MWKWWETKKRETNSSWRLWENQIGIRGEVLASLHSQEKKKKKSMNLLFQAKNYFQIQPCNILLTIGFPTHPLKILFFILMIFYDSKKKSSKLYQTSFI
jgi:hypothetical protein